MRYDGGMALKTRPLDSGFGLEALDVDLSKPLPDEQFAEIEQAFFRGQVLVVRAQTLTPAQFAAWGRRFGPPEPHVIDQFHHPADPNILILSNRVRDGRPAGLADAGTYFHTDYSYLPVPARATTLYSIEVPREGGNTLFANQYAAYDDLTAAMKARIDPLVGVHHYGNRNNLDVATPHRGVGADRRAGGIDAAGHASDRAAASGDRTQGVVRSQRELVRDRRHAR